MEGGGGGGRLGKGGEVEPGFLAVVAGKAGY